MEFKHTSILLKESIDYLITDKQGIYVDCTMGGAGHTRGFASNLEVGGLVIGIDQDDDAISVGRERLLNKFACETGVYKSNFENFDRVLDELGIEKIDGIFFDLGVSSYQLDNPERGFSYMHDGPLDMRMDKTRELSAAYVVNNYKEEELAEIIYKYGEERWSKRIAQFIVQARKEKIISTTFELVDIIKKAIPKGARIDGPHPAKRTFQAIRIEVNNELGILTETMEKAVDRLKSGGRIGVITFHSLEDRIIKQTFQKLQKGCTCPKNIPFCVCGNKPKLKKIGNIVPSEQEIEENPRSRSARLRYAIKI